VGECAIVAVMLLIAAIGHLMLLPAHRTGYVSTGRGLSLLTSGVE